MYKYADEDGWLKTGIKLLGNVVRGYDDAAMRMWRPIASRAVAGYKALTDKSKTYDQHYKRISGRAYNRSSADISNARRVINNQNNAMAATGYNIGDGLGNFFGDPRYIAADLASAGLLRAVGYGSKALRGAKIGAKAADIVADAKKAMKPRELIKSMGLKGPYPSTAATSNAIRELGRAGARANRVPIASTGRIINSNKLYHRLRVSKNPILYANNPKLAKLDNAARFGNRLNQVAKHNYLAQRYKYGIPAGTDLGAPAWVDNFWSKHPWIQPAAKRPGGLTELLSTLGVYGLLPEIKY